jgi:hypothetical protein
MLLNEVLFCGLFYISVSQYISSNSMMTDELERIYKQVVAT